MKVLYITTFGQTMIFFKSFIKQLIDEGHIVDIATNENDGKSNIPNCYREWGCKIFHLSCTRNPLSLWKNLRTIKEIRNIVKAGKYDIVHCHTPIASFCTRIACKKLRETGLKLIYTAHGFHFYTGAPLKNWLLYYPIEWLCSWWTDTLITINTEDYERAKKHLHAKKTVYVPGVGIDTKKFAIRPNGRAHIREELELKDDHIMLLSVGELNENKNHKSVIKACALCSSNNSHVSIANEYKCVYVIVGRGFMASQLQNLGKQYDVDVRLMGYRNDVADFYDAADVFILPSFREGLNVSLMEAMASKLAVTCSKIRGNIDLIRAPLFDPTNIEEIRNAIITAINQRDELGNNNQEKIKSFDLVAVNEEIKEIYSL